MMTIFRKMSLALLITAGLLAAAPTAQAQLGVAAGANFNSLSDVQDAQNDRNFDSATGFHAGVFYDLSLGLLSVRPGVFYMDLGELSQNGDLGGGDVTQGVGRSFDASLLAVPVDLRLSVLSLPFVSPYVTAGPVFRLALNDDGGSDAASDDAGFSTNDFTVAGNVGVGVEVNLPGGGLRLYPELRYSFGLQQYVDQLPGDFQAEDGGRLNVFMLRLGVGF